MALELLRRVVVLDAVVPVAADARRAVVVALVLAALDAAGAGVLDTGVTSTVLEAAVDRVVRRRGVGEGVAMGGRSGCGAEAEECEGDVPIRPASSGR